LRERWCVDEAAKFFPAGKGELKKREANLMIRRRFRSITF